MSKELVSQLTRLAGLGIARDGVRSGFLERVENEQLTRDDGELTHMGVFVMAIDERAKVVYLGHHKKSDRWIPHGGHVDQGELLEQTLEREIWEEWGRRMTAGEIGEPVLLTITEIENPKQWEVCRRHYDVWYFVKMDKDEFAVEPEILQQEFHEAEWLNLEEARRRVGSTPTVLEALGLVEAGYFNTTYYYTR